MPRRIGLFVVAVTAVLVSGEVAAERAQTPPQCRKSDRCTLPGGETDDKAGRPDGKVRHDTVKNSIGNVR
ncbi:MAG: hypothetical protein ABS35_25860 [Kaistia sp. SCN 65-12]|nr:MAG: hypothetical protein ABS35_25860 [Kaistia sp. SCN 65-12]